MPLTKIQSQEANGATSVTFSSLGTAKELLFTWIDYDPTGGSDEALTFQVTTSSYSNNAPITSGYGRAYHNEGDTTANLQAYDDGSNTQAQGNDTGDQWISTLVDQDQSIASCSGTLTLFSINSTAKVKMFFVRSMSEAGSAAYENHVGGYVNTTEAITAVRFKGSGGGTFTGTFTLYKVV